MLPSQVLCFTDYDPFLIKWIDSAVASFVNFVKMFPTIFALKYPKIYSIAVG